MRAPAAVGLALLLAGCGSGGAPAAAPSPTAPAEDPVRATLDGVPLLLEVADDPDERAVGLMRRSSIPPGTGMIFLYDAPVNARYYMYDVPVPLRAVFLLDSEVVFTALMPPCREQVPQDCPTYGPDSPFDTVVEVAPETLPDVRPGDRLTVAS